MKEFDCARDCKHSFDEFGNKAWYPKQIDGFRVVREENWYKVQMFGSSEWKTIGEYRTLLDARCAARVEMKRNGLI